MKKAFLFSAVLSLAVSTLAAITVENTKAYSDPKIGLTVVAGELQLPAGGIWSTVEPTQGSSLYQVQIQPPQEITERLKGERMQQVEIQRRLDENRGRIQSLFWPCHEYAEEHKGIGPASWSELNTNRFKYQLSYSSNYFLIPNVNIGAARHEVGPVSTSAVPLILELKPLVDDGKHWVVLANGQSERRTVDKDLVARYDLNIEAEKLAEIKPLPKVDEIAKYQIFALRRPDVKAGAIKLELCDARSDAKLECTWDCSSTTEGEQAILKQWAELRAARWTYMLLNSDSLVLRTWLAIQNRVYGAGGESRDVMRAERDGERTDMFGVLGGRAAIRETLQMQVLRGADSRPSDQTMIPISEVKSLEVKSHPFEEMLKGSSGGSLPLAANVPMDRFFVYFAKPQAIMPLLDDGNEFIFKVGLPMAGNNISYNLKTRYLSRLGISEEWLKLVLATGAIKEVGVLMPDLFLIDGTEMTVIAKLTSPKLFRPVLETIGLSGLAAEIKSMPLKSGGEAFWALNGDLLMFSTSRKELENVMALHAIGGKDSLGQSAEFRYMLTQLPLEPDTRAYVYISDPFIRRLISPQTKIAQLKRLLARRDLEMLSAAVLLFRYDGQAEKLDIQTLTAKGYVPQELVALDYTIFENLVAESAKYGTPANMKSLLENPVDKVTHQEADAYTRYVENYSRFWRQFFDPIAMRLDDRQDGGLSLTTFILPLLDSSIYNGIKEVVAAKENGKALSVPEPTPQPVAMLSLNLQDKAWIEITKTFSRRFARFTRLDPSVFDELGPTFHLAIQDSDPILSVGSGDVLGVFGGDVTMMGHGEMFMIPVLVAILTRPCNLMVELRNPAAVITALNLASSSPVAEGRRWEPIAQYYKVEGRDAWICAVDFFRLIKFRLGVEVRNGFLFLSNVPWSSRPRDVLVRKADLNGVALTVRPEAGKLQLPGLFTSAMENYRSAAMHGIGDLYPLMLGGAANVTDALAMHATLFGYAPEHPEKGMWIWENGELQSSIFGTISRQVQPEYKEGDQDFGAFNGIEELFLNLQFENTGLRVKADWRCKK